MFVLKNKMKNIIILFLLLSNSLLAIEFSIDDKVVYGVDLHRVLKEKSQTGMFPYDDILKKHESFFWNPVNFNEYFSIRLNHFSSIQEDFLQIHFYPYKKELGLSFPDLRLLYSDFENFGRVWGEGIGVAVGPRINKNKKIRINEKLIYWERYSFNSVSFINNFDFNVVRVLTRFEKSVLIISFDSKDETFFNFIKSLNFNKIKILDTFEAMPDKDSIIIELQRDLSKTERYVIRFCIPKKIIPSNIRLKYPNLK